MSNQETYISEENNLHIIFKVDKGFFCVDSKHISTIMQLPTYQTLPDARPCVTGIFTHRNAVVEMFDLRSAFHIPTLNQEYEEFAKMLDNRKQDHINWVTELERTLETGEKFKLATDPHKCAFGKWYDLYSFVDDEASRHLKKIEEPHRLLHQAADEVNKCAQNCTTCTRAECLKKVLTHIKEDCMPQILRLLEETKEIFRSTVYHEMVLLLEGSALGIVVDEVISVEKLFDVGGQDTLRTFYTSPLVANVKKSAKWSELILELNLSALQQNTEDVICASSRIV